MVSHRQAGAAAPVEKRVVEIRRPDAQAIKRKRHPGRAAEAPRHKADGADKFGKSGQLHDQDRRGDEWRNNPRQRVGVGLSLIHI